jgi:hypothetical protein
MARRLQSRSTRSAAVSEVSGTYRAAARYRPDVVVEKIADVLDTL